MANVEIKHIDLNESMVRAIAKQAEAERLRRAKVIDSEGELQAAERFARAGEILSARSQGLQLRYLSVLQNIAGEHTNTVIFPLPLELLDAFWPRAKTAEGTEPEQERRLRAVDLKPANRGKEERD